MSATRGEAPIRGHCFTTRGARYSLEACQLSAFICRRADGAAHCSRRAEIRATRRALHARAQSLATSRMPMIGDGENQAAADDPRAYWSSDFHECTTRASTRLRARWTAEESGATVATEGARQAGTGELQRQAGPARSPDCTRDCRVKTRFELSTRRAADLRIFLLLSFCLAWGSISCELRVKNVEQLLVLPSAARCRAYAPTSRVFLLSRGCSAGSPPLDPRMGSIYGELGAHFRCGPNLELVSASGSFSRRRAHKRARKTVRRLSSASTPHQIILDTSSPCCR